MTLGKETGPKLSSVCVNKALLLGVSHSVPDYSTQSGYDSFSLFTQTIA